MPFNTFYTNHGLISFDCNWVVSRLRDLLRQEGIPGHYSGHSFRQGAATWAKQVGIPDTDIQLLGRWKSDAYKRYIEVRPEHIFSVSRRLQTSPPGPPHARPVPSPPAAPLGILDPHIPGSDGRHVGVVGRAGRGAGEPGPASGVAASGTQHGPRRGGRPPLPRQHLSLPAAPEPARGA